MFPDRGTVYFQPMSYQQPDVKGTTERVGFQPQASLAEVKQRVEKLVAAKGKTLGWLQQRVGITKTGYREMWQRESVRVVVMQAMAETLGVNMAVLLSADAPDTLPAVSEPLPVYRAKPRYLEERVADLERELQQLKEKLPHK